MEVAFADHDITPGPGEEMAGYGFYMNRRATGTLDALHARACAFRDGAETALLIQLDLIGLGADHVREVRERLARSHGLALGAVMFHCTHTHTGPSSRSFFGVGQLTQALRDALTRQICETAAEALAAFRPLKRAAWFDEDFPGIGFNRDHPDGPVDTRVRGLLLEPEAEAPAVIVDYACHPVVLGRKAVYSADYPGAVAGEFGASGVRCVFLTGPCGDIDPLINRANWGSGTPDTLRIYGWRIARVVESGMASAENVSLALRCATSRMIDLPMVPPTRQELNAAVEHARQALIENPTDGKARAKFNAGQYLLNRLDTEGAADADPVEVQTFCLGDVTIAAVSAELFTGLGEIIRQRSGLRRLLLPATSNGLVRYIATQDSVERQTYAAQSAFFYGTFPQQAGGGETFARNAAAFIADVARPVE